jgi:hypothetical protein
MAFEDLRVELGCPFRVALNMERLEEDLFQFIIDKLIILLFIADEGLKHFEE